MFYQQIINNIGQYNWQSIPDIEMIDVTLLF